MIKSFKKKSLKKKLKFCCKICDYNTSNLFDFKKHKLTAKHKNMINGKKNRDAVDFICDACGKEYKHQSGLSRHLRKHTEMENKALKMREKSQDATKIYHFCDDKKKSQTNEILEITEKDAEINALKIEILKKELKHKDQLIDILKTKGNTTNNNTNNFNNCNNKNLTVNLYLNEHCKDAMNLTDFVNQITVQLEDILFQDRTTSAEGLSNIITNQLKNLEPTERPIHCSDQRRQHFYIKEGEEWKQKSGDDEMEQSVRQIQIKQLQALKEWEDNNPNFMENDRLQAKYTKFMEKIMYGCGDKKKMERNVKEVKKKISQTIMIKEAMDNFGMTEEAVDDD
tara:strand:+ start:397 stop:1416 length:1020 start_codon:yes stop_codon:yes gene_type:complete